MRINVEDLWVRDHLVEAADLLGTSMRQNPNHLAAYGDDEGRRVQAHAALMRAAFRVSSDWQVVAARRGEALLAVAAYRPVGSCQPTPRQRLSMVPTLWRMGPRRAARVLTWLQAWSKRDLAAPHLHVGPIAVGDDYQGQGVGSALLKELCTRADLGRQQAYLETDKARNVGFYQRFGFEVVGEDTVLGVPNWFMRRTPLLDIVARPAPGRPSLPSSP